MHGNQPEVIQHTMSDVITAIVQVTPEWLTRTLHGMGALPSGHVTAIQTRAHDTNTAVAFPLTVVYSDTAPLSAPKQLFLKLGGRKPEVDFYHFILPQMHNVATIRCYSAAFDDLSGQSHLLMDDVSATHAGPEDALPPPQVICQQMVAILARLHAQWWEQPDLRATLAPVLDDVPGFILGQAQAGFAHFVDTLGDRLSDQRRRWYERILSAWPLPAWKARLDAHTAVTLVHGDSHWWNFMLPRESGPIYVVDWAVWHRNIGVSDLAYTFGQLCYRDWRTHFEERLVRYYHTRLIEYGVREYDWAQCWHDYRLMMVFHTLWPIFHHRWAANDIWWRNLECCLSAFEDLHCEEFLS
jgi:hypothetical protein